ncbi:MAG: DUF2141 domain-containing protein [Polaribacter sp.]
MKKLFLLILFTISGIFSANAQEEETFDLTIKVLGMSTDTGKVFIGIYDKKEHFLKKGKGTNAVVKNKKAVAYFKNLKKGDYAVSLFHDENNNKIMDTKIFGIPKEPYGFSNDASGFMGPPKFKDAKFSLEADKTITIHVD